MDRFLPIAEVERITSLKKSKIYEMVREGQFPAQHEITSRRRAWLEREVQAWIEQRTNVNRATSRDVMSASVL